MRLWGIRHIRYFWHRTRFNIWWYDVGRHLGMFPNERDITYLEDIWKGKR